MDKSRVFAIAGFVFSCVAAAFLVASFASPYWVESKKAVAPSGFQNMGLWVVCFHNYYPTDRPITNKRYEGCWQAVSYEMRDLKAHFYPSIIMAVQVLVTLSLMMSLTIVVFNVVYFVHCCPFGIEKGFVLAGAILSFISALFLAISTIIFGVKVDQDREWLPQPDANYLSWAFGFAILACLLHIFGGSCMATDFYRLFMADRYDRGSAAPPPVKYSAPPPQYNRAAGRRR